MKKFMIRNLIRIKAIVLFLLIISFIIVLLSGIGLHFVPYGRIVRETNWVFLGFSKWALEQFSRY